MALTAVTVYAPDRTLPALVTTAVVFGAINLPSVGLWAVAGTRLRRWLAQPRRLLIFNAAMAALLVVSVVPMLV